eukprot:6084261-Alexandrium_andersonii.AAC.1
MSSSSSKTSQSARSPRDRCAVFRARSTRCSPGRSSGRMGAERKQARRASADHAYRQRVEAVARAEDR